MTTSTQRRLSDPEFLALNTVHIATEIDGEVLPLGTGFFYQFLSTDEVPIPAIVTNKHVLKDIDNAILVFNPAGPNGEFNLQGQKLPFMVKDFQPLIHNHPNPAVDLAFIPVSRMFSKLRERGDPVFATFFRRENFPKPEEWSELTALEDIVVIGYPDGIYDSWNNLPVLRRGITASHPKIDFEQRPEFLIDAAIYTGSSGSPVVLYKKNDIMLGQDLNLGKDKPRLLGILYGVFQHLEKGTMECVPIPTARKKVPVIHVPNNIGIAIKSTQLDGFIPLIDKKLSDEREAELKRQAQVQSSSDVNRA